MIVILDMDGVVTSEEGYWRSAWCSVKEFAAALGHEPSRTFMQTPDPWALLLDRTVIGHAKQRMINTNWDLCHLAVLALIHRLVAHSPVNAERLLTADWQDGAPLPALEWPVMDDIDGNVLLSEALSLVPDEQGFELMDALAQHVLPTGETLLRRQGPVWCWLFDAFQRWFNGNNPTQSNGILHREPLVLPPDAIRSALHALRESGHILGIATGRTRAELLPTLARHDLLRFFEATRIVTHDEVDAAEKHLAGTAPNGSSPLHLSKPHPFPFLKALHPDAASLTLAVPPWPEPVPGTVIVGDTAGDMRGGSLIGARTIAVLTGAGGPSAASSLRLAGADEVIADITHLPEAL